MSSYEKDTCEQTAEIARIVKLWLEGNIEIEYINDLYYKNNTIRDINESKQYFYDIIMNEIKKQLNSDDITLIENRLNGFLVVCMDEIDIKAFINNDDNIYFNRKNDNIDDYDYDDYDDYDD